MKKLIFVLVGGFLVTCYSCKKDEEPEIKTIEYTVKGRITPTEGDSNFYWPNVWCSFFISYDDYQSPPTMETEMARADSLGYVELKYSRKEDRPIDYIILRVHSDSLFVPFDHYCVVQPICNIDTTYFYYDDTWTFHGECE